MITHGDCPEDAEYVAKKSSGKKWESRTFILTISELLSEDIPVRVL